MFDLLPDAFVTGLTCIALTACLFGAAIFICWLVGKIKDFCKRRKDRAEALAYIIALFHHPDQQQKKPSDWWHQDKTSLRAIIRDHAWADLHERRLDRLSTLLKDLTQELGYEMQKVDAAAEKIILIKKDPS